MMADARNTCITKTSAAVAQIALDELVLISHEERFQPAALFKYLNTVPMQLYVLLMEIQYDMVLYCVYKPS